MIKEVLFFGKCYCVFCAFVYHGRWDTGGWQASGWRSSDGWQTNR